MRHAVLETPVLLFLVLFVPILFLFGAWKRRANVPYRKIFILCGGTDFAVFLLANIVNLCRPGILWEDEGHILAVAAAYLHGQPMYHSRWAPDFYALVYGPLTYLVDVPFMAGFHHPIPAMRVATLVINLANIAVLFFILRKWLSRSTAFGILSIATAILLSTWEHLFGTRGDPWMLFSMSIALLGALSENWLTAVILSGVFSSFTMGFKPTVVPVVILLLAIVYKKHGLRASIASALISVAGALSVFLLRGISLSNYLQWLVLSDHRRLVHETLLGTVMAGIFLIAPAVLVRLLAARPRDRRNLGIVLPVLGGIALAACVVTGAKDGAGPWHIWPMLPFMLLWVAYEVSACSADASASSRSTDTGTPASGSFPVGARSVVVAIVLAATVVTVRYGIRSLKVLYAHREVQQRIAERAAENAIDALTDQAIPEQNLVMGYGKDPGDYRSDLRFELLLRGQQDFFDENAVVEGTKEGVPIPQSVVQRILGCQDVWMVPHGDVPFSTLRTGVLPMSPTPYLFPDSIRLGFPRSHVLLKKGDIYDLWGCPPAG